MLRKKIYGGRGQKWKEGREELKLPSRKKCTSAWPAPLGKRKKELALSNLAHLHCVGKEDESGFCRIALLQSPHLDKTAITLSAQTTAVRCQWRDFWWVTGCVVGCKRCRWHSQCASSVTYNNKLHLLRGYYTEWWAHLFTKYVLTAWGLLDLNQTVGGAISVFKSRFFSTMSCLMFTFLNSELNCCILTVV